MKNIPLIFYTKAVALLIVLLFSFGSCLKEPNEQVANNEVPFKNGTTLSYTVKENSTSKGLSKGELKFIGGMTLNTEEREVIMYFDSKNEKYYIKTRRLDGIKSRTKDFVEPEWKEVVETNASTVTYNERGMMISSIAKTVKQDQGLAFLVTPYVERAKMMKEMIKGINAKSGSYIVEVQTDTTVVKITQTFEPGNEEDESLVGCTAVSYVNVRYGVPVISEMYNPNGKLTSKVTLLYKMVNDIPVVAYEESISYSVDHTGEVIENRTVTHYENINISNF